MSVVLATTSYRVDAMAESEPGEGRTATSRGTVSGHTSSPTGSEVWQAGGGESTVDAVILCDPITVERTDRFTDLGTGDVWEVQWARKREGLGLTHMRVGVTRVEGQVV